MYLLQNLVYLPTYTLLSLQRYEKVDQVQALFFYPNY